MSDILKEILKDLPANKISDASFEGANIVLYTKDEDFFLNDKGIVKKIVNKIKKRIELRPDPTLCLELEKAEKKIRSIIDKTAGIDKITFDPQRSVVIIEVEKPGTTIGKKGELLQKIKAETFWIPIVRRKPAIRNQLIENIRSVLYKNSDYRKKFLHKTGERIYNGWLRGKKDEWVRITPLGGSRQVGRSCILLQTPESRVLLDCGVDVASEKQPYPHLEAPEFDIKELDAIILSHSHIDHSGLIPLIYKYGFRGPVYCTRPTRDVSALLQLDLIKIQRGNDGEPIYTSEDVKEMVKHTISLEYGEVTDVTPDLRITLYNAGHILGSAMIHIHIGNGLHNFLYTGDLKYAKTNLLSPANTYFPRLETLMIESTYGAREAVMTNPKEQDKTLGEMITNTIKRGGKVLMPVLGSGRAQEIIVLIERMIRTGTIEEIPIYIDGLVWDITAIHTAYPEFLNNTIREQIFHKDNNPFIQDNIKRIGSAKERKELLDYKGPCVILATSGMLVGGPSVEYLKQLGNNKKNSLIFTCYQGQGSLGRIIQRGVKEISFKNGSKNEVTQINLEVHKLEITGHSDRRELMNFVGKCNPRARKVIVNHGESSRCLDLARSIHKTYRIETIAPKNLESVRLV
ncbi:beta-CASP ribonuclease aCPSF1 [Candidatus Woesearchaeota archaeon]|jgi:hypothetical protein|nr:beta-CASP ribonuclease aCPSF1 [Candidatus Woesearchaeota archaeon]